MKVKRIVGLLLAITMLMLCTGNVFSEQTVVMELEGTQTQQPEVIEPEVTIEPTVELEVIEGEPTAEPPEDETPATEEPENLLDSYLAQLGPEDQVRLLDEISYLEAEGIAIDAIVLDELIEQISPADIPEIQPFESVPYDEIIDPSNVLYSTPEELAQLRQENAAKIAEYKALLEAGELSEEDIRRYGLEEFLYPQVNEVSTIIPPLTTQNAPSAFSLGSPLEGRVSKAPMISSGTNHTVYLASDGEVWTWGIYGNGGGIVSEMPAYKVPTKIGLSNVLEVSAGPDHAVALKANGTVWQWGHHFEELQIGSSMPVQVPQLSNIIAISAGGGKNLALKADGTVWQWNVGTTNVSQVVGLSNVKQIAAGYGNGHVLLTNGTVWTWSNNQITQVTGIGGEGYLENVIQIAASTGAIYALLDDGTAVAWGDNLYGQLGINDIVKLTYEPRAVVDENNVPVTGIVSVCGGPFNGGFIKQDGTLWVAGSCNNGDYSNGQSGIWYHPIQSRISNVEMVSFGTYFTIALLTDGSLKGVGSNYSNSLGIGDLDDNSVPNWINIKTPTAKITQISSDFDHTLALKSDGTVWASGSNTNGRLGNDSDTNQTVPVQVLGENGEGYLENITYVATGRHCSMAIQNDGSLWAWGSNFAGQIGNGTASGSFKTPVKVQDAEDIKSVDIGYEHVIALKNDGTVLTWGENSSGQLGRKNGYYTPGAVFNLTDVIAVSATGNHSMVLKSDGTVWTWGANNYGQFGCGNATGGYMPVQAIDEDGNVLDNIIAISSGRNFSLALRADGKIYAWGQNNYGQLGDNTKVNKNKAVLVTGITNATAITTGHYSSFAICADGSVWSWGYNGNGNLGVNDTKNKQVPTRITGPSDEAYLSDLSMIAAGNNLTTAVKTDGTVLAWGYNQYGQFGIGTSGDRSTVPVSGYVLGVTYDDYGDDFDEATLILWNQTVTGEINSTNDIDCFEFNTNSSSITIENPNNLVITVYDSSHRLIYPVNGYYQLTGASQYFIKVQRAELGSYSFAVQDASSQPNEVTKTIQCSANESVRVAVKVNSLMDVAAKTFTITYDPTMLEISDLAAVTPAKETAAGAVNGYPINISKVSPGEIQFKYTRDIGGKGISGILNIVEFRALADGQTTVELQIY